jgi:uncharacterized membrane protein
LLRSAWAAVMASFPRRRSASTVRLAAASGPSTLTVGQKFADTVAATMGSWRFMITKTTIPVFWISADGIRFILLTQAITDLTALLKRKAS